MTQTLFSIIVAFLSAFVAVLTVIAALISVAVGFYPFITRSSPARNRVIIMTIVVMLK
jgi:Na+/H+ antiporter NhaB